MPRITLPSEKSGGAKLNEAEGEANYALWRPPTSVTISGDVLTVEGSGRYSVLPQTGTTDQIISIVVTQEVINGARIELSPQTSNHTITLVHGPNLRLAGGINIELTTIYSSVELQHRGANLWVQKSPLMYIP